MATPDVGQTGRKSPQDALLQIEEDRQQALDLLHELALCEERGGRLSQEVILATIISKLFDTVLLKGGLNKEMEQNSPAQDGQ